MSNSKLDKTISTTKNELDVLRTLNVSIHAKRRGGKNGDGKTATFCKNANTPRLTLPARFLADGYRSGTVGLSNGTPLVVLSKNVYNNTFGALHPSQHFITVVGSDVRKTLLTSHTWTVKNEKTTDGLLTFELTPNEKTTSKH